MLGDNYFSAEYVPTGSNILWSMADSSGTAPINPGWRDGAANDMLARSTSPKRR